VKVTAQALDQLLFVRFADGSVQFFGALGRAAAEPQTARSVASLGSAGSAGAEAGAASSRLSP
jgi:hypothetical protein